MQRSHGAILAAALGVGCVGRIGDRDAGTEAAGHPPGSEPLSCEALDPGPAPLRRLTPPEYDRTVRDLLGDTTQPAKDFPPEAETLGFHNQAGSMIVTQLHAQYYMQAAEELAAAGVGDLAALLPCDPAGQERACAEEFVAEFGRRALRRPLQDEERARYLALFDLAHAAEGFDVGIQLVIEAMLQSSHFLYRVELATPTPVKGDVVPLAPHELASRLSYLVWGSMPDDALLDAASAGQLETKDDVATQARRLLDDPRAREGVAAFHEQWLDLFGIDMLAKSTSAYPSFDVSLPPLLREETLAFVNDVVFDGAGDVETLFTASYSFMGAELAAFYGVDGPAGAAPERVELDATQRAGFLTHASVLATQAKSDQSSPILRGKFVRERLLCQPLPPPPDDVNIMPPEVDPSATTRERFAQHTADPACKGCHQLIDPIGFGFEHYDGAGLWRQTENSLAIDDSGELVETVDIDGPFVGAVDLASKLAGSEQVRECITLQWFRFAHGRGETEADTCSLDLVGDAFASSGYDIRELIVALTQTDAFFYRHAIAPGGS